MREILKEKLNEINQAYQNICEFVLPECKEIQSQVLQGTQSNSGNFFYKHGAALVCNATEPFKQAKSMQQHCEKLASLIKRVCELEDSVLALINACYENDDLNDLKEVRKLKIKSNYLHELINLLRSQQVAVIEFGKALNKLIEAEHEFNNYQDVPIDQPFMFITPEDMLIHDYIRELLKETNIIPEEFFDAKIQTLMRSLSSFVKVDNHPQPDSYPEKMFTAPKPMNPLFKMRVPKRWLHEDQMRDSEEKNTGNTQPKRYYRLLPQGRSILEGFKTKRLALASENPIRYISPDPDHRKRQRL